MVKFVVLCNNHGNMRRLLSCGVADVWFGDIDSTRESQSFYAKISIKLWLLCTVMSHNFTIVIFMFILCY